MYKLIRPLIFTQDSERMHNFMLWQGEKIFSHSPFKNAVTAMYKFDCPELETEFLGIKFKNPVGIPGGFDKNARLLNFWPALGLGFVEIGSVTAAGGNSNPSPRLFRLPDDIASVNRMGLNNIGADAMANKLLKIQQMGKISNIPLGINIAKTHDPNILGHKAVEDFCYSLKKLHPFADYIALNVSCPNTAEGKTFEDPSALQELLTAVVNVAAEENILKPILVKVSPDITIDQLDKILEICEQRKIAGYIIANCSAKREGMKTLQAELARVGKGGLSGEPIRVMTTKLIAHAYKQLKRPCIIGLGGIDSAEDAYEKIKAGASLLQAYNGFIYEGPGLVKKINQGLVKLLERDGFKNISEAVGVEAK